MPSLILQVILLVLMISIGIASLEVRDLLAAVVLFSAFSFFAVLIYIVLHAPDVAFTEAIIGVIATLFYITALHNIGKRGCS